MTDRDPSSLTNMEFETDGVFWFLMAMSAFGFAMAALGIIGEVLGWWNDTGELLVTIGGLLGLLISSAGVAYGASRPQVRAVTGTVSDNNSILQDNNRLLRSNNQKLDKLDKLEVIEQALVAEDGRTSRLDVLQVELDRQTGVLDQQVGLLTAIRDRL